MELAGWVSGVLAALALLLCSPSVASGADPATNAEPRAISTIWTIDGPTVRLRVMIPIAAARKLVAANAPAPSLGVVASAVSQAFVATTPASGCEAVDQGEGVGQVYTLALTPGLDRFEMVLACPQANGLVLKDNLLFDRDPGHIDYAQIRVGAGQPVLDAFTRDRRSIALPASPTPLRGADPLAFAKLAAMRMVGSIAAIAILFGSVLLSRRWLDLARIGASLAIGYLAAIGLALSGVLAPDQSLVGALPGLLAATLGLGVLAAIGGDALASPRWRTVARIGAGLVLLGLVVAATLQSPAAGLATFGIAVFGLASVRTSQLEPRLHALAFAPTAAFALLDGLSPASDLMLLHPSAAQLAPILFGYDLGGWLSCGVIAAIAMGVIWLAGLRLRAWRTIGSELGGAALIGLGLFGFVSRLYS